MRCVSVYCALCTVYWVHQVVEFGAGEGENKEEEEKAKDPVLEAQQIAKRILGYNSSDPGRQSVYPRIGKYQQHFTIRHLSSVPEPYPDPYDVGPCRIRIRLIICAAPDPDSSISKQKK